MGRRIETLLFLIFVILVLILFVLTIELDSSTVFAVLDFASSVTLDNFLKTAASLLFLWKAFDAVRVEHSILHHLASVNVGPRAQTIFALVLHAMTLYTFIYVVLHFSH